MSHSWFEEVPLYDATHLYCGNAHKHGRRRRQDDRSTHQPHAQGWRSATESSWTLWHTERGPLQDTHGTPVPERGGRGWPKTRYTRDTAREDQGSQHRALITDMVAEHARVHHRSQKRTQPEAFTKILVDKRPSNRCRGLLRYRRCNLSRFS